MHELISKVKQGLSSKNPLADPKWAVKKSTHLAYIREGVMFMDRNLTASDYSMAPDGKQATNYLLNASINRVVKDLLLQATVKPTDSWRKTRNAIAYTYACLGGMTTAEKIKKLENPVK